MNDIIIIGRITKQPETTSLKDGTTVTNFSMADTTKRKHEYVTKFWKITIWGDRCGKIVPSLKKGSYIKVSGEVEENKIREYNGKNYCDLTATASKITFMPDQKPVDADAADEQYPKLPIPKTISKEQEDFAKMLDDEDPF